MPTASAVNIIGKLARVMVCSLLYTKPHGKLPENSTERVVIHSQAIPLKSLRYDVTINGALAEVTLTQEYTNPENVPITLDYRFPISNKLAFSKFEAEYKDKKLVGKVKAKEEAKKEYEENVKKGNTVVYADINEQTKDVMQLKLGNFPAGESIKIKLTYTLALDILEYSKWSLRIPSTLTPRFINKEIQALPDFEEAKRRYPKMFRFTTLKPYTWDIYVKIEWPETLRKIDSHTHEDVLRVSVDGKSAIVHFDPAIPQYPDKDFELIIQDKNAFHSKVVVTETNQKFEDPRLPKYAALVHFLPSFYEWNTNENGEMIETGAKFDKKNEEFLMESTDAEFIFILDRSGSMGGNRIANAKKALISFLQSLPKHSKFNIFCFGSSFTQMFPESQEMNTVSLANAVSQVQKFNSDMGGTNISPAVKAAMKLEGFPKTQRIVFLLTDGAIQDTENFLKSVKNEFFYNEARLFTIGIGNGVSTYLVQEAAKFGNGRSLIISDDSDPTERILSLVKESLTPSLTDFKLEFNKDEIWGIAPIPRGRSHVTRNHPFMMYVLPKNSLMKKQDKTTRITLRYWDTSDKKEKRKEFVIDLSGHIERSDTYFQMFVKHYTDDEAREYGNIYLDPAMFSRQTDDRKKLNTMLAVSYQVVVPKYTAFICVIDDSGKNKAEKEVEIPNLESADHGHPEMADMAVMGGAPGGYGSAGPTLAMAPQAAPGNRANYNRKKRSSGRGNSANMADSVKVKPENASASVTKTSLNQTKNHSQSLFIGFILFLVFSLFWER